VNRRYRSKSWLDPRIEVRRSGTAGCGSFATAPIMAGEIVIEWGGVVLTKDQLGSFLAKPDSEIPIGEGLHIATPAAVTDLRDYFLNHSCDPSLWMADEVTFGARRDLSAGEELTADYAFWQDENDLVASWNCTCGSPLCRGRVTGADWRLPDLQARYRGHFSPFVNARIGKLR
jgi:uncharacterized protein